MLYDIANAEIDVASVGIDLVMVRCIALPTSLGSEMGIASVAMLAVSAMRHVARQGFVGESGSMSPQECIEVVEHVIQLAAQLECRLDLRWIEHGYGHYLTELECGGSVDWRDMVKFHAMRTLTFFDHSKPKMPSRADGAANSLSCEIEMAKEIAALVGKTNDQRLQMWQERSGLSRPTFYRRLKAGSSA